jgi:hypothetical protein
MLKNGLSGSVCDGLGQEMYIIAEWFVWNGERGTTDGSLNAVCTGQRGSVCC